MPANIRLISRVVETFRCPRRIAFTKHELSRDSVSSNVAISSSALVLARLTGYCLVQIFDGFHQLSVRLERTCSGLVGTKSEIKIGDVIRRIRYRQFSFPFLEYLDQIFLSNPEL